MYNTILITGVSSGLGLGLAKYYLQQGKTVYAINRHCPEELADDENFYFSACDLTDEKAVKQSIDDLLVDLEILDLVVLNAGILKELKDLRETSLEEIRQVMDINTWANKTVIDCLDSATTSVKQIVAISSGASISGNRGWNAYGLSKTALNMLIKLYAQECPDIHFSALAPGLVDTNMQDYICALEENGQFPVVDRLKSCRGTELMPTPEQLAPKLDAGFAKVFELDSGEYTDIRSLYP
jgi:NAD(P)-dependent dehydrogenase (short-subunit alcohol dehydrogenase family)